MNQIYHLFSISLEETGRVTGNYDMLYINFIGYNLSERFIKISIVLLGLFYLSPIFIRIETIAYYWNYLLMINIFEYKTVKHELDNIMIILYLASGYFSVQLFWLLRMLQRMRWKLPKLNCKK